MGSADLLSGKMEAGKMEGPPWEEGFDGQFFNLLRDHSMQAFYGSPRHGGNKNNISYKMLQIDSPAYHRSKQVQRLAMANKKVNAVDSRLRSRRWGGGQRTELRQVCPLYLFERGGWITYDDHPDDELISQPIAPLGTSCGPDDKRYRRVMVYPDGSSRIVLPSEADYNNIAACVGSGTVSYAALAWRYMQEDFKMKSTYGHVTGSTLEDWPISYEDMEPFYEKAEWEIGVAGDDSQNPFAPPRKKPQPMPPFVHNKAALLLDAAARRLGLHPFPIPVLRNSVPYGGRPACIRMRNCNGYPCPVNAKCGTHNTVIPVALAYRQL